jgi:hypothetical protein
MHCQKEVYFLMNSINIFKNRQNDRALDYCYIVNEKIKKLKAVDPVNNYEIYNYLRMRLSHIYLNGIPIYNIIFNDSHDGVSAYDTTGGAFYLSAAIILAMEPSDFLVNGNLAPECKDKHTHQWVEFNYFGEWYILDGALTRPHNKWFIQDTELAKIYNREHYYSVFMPTINFKKNNAELMESDFVVKHHKLLENPEWSYDDKLFFYYTGRQIEECKKRLYENIEVDDNGNIISYNDSSIEKSQSK